MVVKESLENVRVAVKGGGNIVSHPPVFSPDSK
jgi:rRNA maturation protein Nop10